MILTCIKIVVSLAIVGSFCWFLIVLLEAAKPRLKHLFDMSPQANVADHKTFHSYQPQNHHEHQHQQLQQLQQLQESSAHFMEDNKKLKLDNSNLRRELQEQRVGKDLLEQAVRKKDDFILSNNFTVTGTVDEDRNPPTANGRTPVPLVAPQGPVLSTWKQIQQMMYQNQEQPQVYQQGLASATCPTDNYESSDRLDMRQQLRYTPSHTSPDRQPYLSSHGAVAGNTGYQPRSDTKTPDKRAKRGEKLRLENERAAAWARERKAKQVAKKSK